MSKIQQEINSLNEKLRRFKNEYLINLLKISESTLDRDKIEIMIAGKLSTGKTSIMNALLERELMPTGIGTTTKSINVIQKGNDIVEVVYEDGQKEDMEFNSDIIRILNEKKLKQLNLYLRDFPFHGVAFIDTPGIDDLTEDFEGMTLSRIPESDAVVFVLDITQGLTRRDKEFFENYMLKYLKDKIFIVFNKLDIVKDEVNEEDLSRIKSQLNGYSVYFVSSKERDSNFVKFKEAIFSYVENTDKKRLIKDRVCSILKTIKDTANIQLTKVKEDLGKTKEELEEKIVSLREKKEELTKRLKEIEEDVDEKLKELKGKVKILIEQKRQEILDKIKYMNYDQIKEFVLMRIDNEIDELVEKIRQQLKREFEFIAPNFDKYTLSLIEFINLAGKLLIHLQSKETKVEDTKIFEEYLKEFSLVIVDQEIDNLFKKLKERIGYSFDRAKREFIEETKLREYGNIDTEIISAQKNLELISLNRDEIEKEIENQTLLVREIERSVESLLMEIGDLR